MKLFYAFYDRSYGYTRAIITLIMGVILVAWPGTAVKTLIIVMGAFLMAAGIVSMIISYKGKMKSENASLLSLNGIVDLVFGLLLVVFPEFFASIVMFLFALVLLLFGIGELFSLLGSRKVAQVPWALYISPILTLGFGVIILFNPFTTTEWLFRFFGIALLFYSVTQFLSTHRIRQNIQEASKLIEDTAYEEVL